MMPKHGPYIRIRYLDDGREVCGQCGGLHSRIEAGLALPMADSVETYQDWAEVSEVESYEAWAGTLEPEPEPDGDVDARGLDEAIEELEAAGLAEVVEDEDEDEPDILDGYTVKQRGRYHVAYDPTGMKISRGKKTAQEAWLVAGAHARQRQMNG